MTVPPRPGDAATPWAVPARDAEATTTIRGSRFIATLRRVPDAEAARDVIAGVRKEHWDATHNCTAFALGAFGETQQSSDDGEPAGTAGAPMLAALRGARTSDVVVVVTRYFGGTLLGAGGLVRAYGGAVSEALAAAGRRERVLVRPLVLLAEHDRAGRLERDLRAQLPARGAWLAGVRFGAQVSLELAVPLDADDDVARWLDEHAADIRREPGDVVVAERPQA